jgi:hypothetical protein
MKTSHDWTEYGPYLVWDDQGDVVICLKEDGRIVRIPDYIFNLCGAVMLNAFATDGVGQIKAEAAALLARLDDQ